MKRSTGLRNYLLSSGSFKDAMDGTVIKIYSGLEPTTADAALSGNELLCVITKNGDGVTGLTLAGEAVGGQITKNTNEVWEGEVIANGQATFFRQEALNDPGGASTTAIRIQGTVDTVLGDINFSDVQFVVGDSKRLNYYVAAMPAV